MAVTVTWDSEKNRKNIEKHKLPLSLGGAVLDDFLRIERYDCEHSMLGEDRWQTIGMAGKILFAVYMERGDTPHIISVRLADAEERRIYNGDDNIYKDGWRRVNA
ncbi:MAG: BrnT family toxin [Spirochaetaceae bacterium]|jgi:uncharacterized DUF497 family protein|nr:BrnT family toxin [Spirochaetaceae bacterium]